MSENLKCIQSIYCRNIIKLIFVNKDSKPLTNWKMVGYFYPLMEQIFTFIDTHFLHTPEVWNGMTTAALSV